MFEYFRETILFREILFFSFNKEGLEALSYRVRKRERENIISLEERLHGINIWSRCS